jgi:hypothetical protein
MENRRLKEIELEVQRERKREREREREKEREREREREREIEKPDIGEVKCGPADYSQLRGRGAIRRQSGGSFSLFFSLLDLTAVAAAMVAVKEK